MILWEITESENEKKNFEIGWKKNPKSYRRNLLSRFSLITQKLRHFYFRHVVFFHPSRVISFDFKHFEKKNFWNRLKKNPKSKIALSLFPTGNFQAAITSEPIDVGTSDQVLWTFQRTYHTIPVEIPNRGGEVFSTRLKKSNIISVFQSLMSCFNPKTLLILAKFCFPSPKQYLLKHQFWFQ